MTRRTASLADERGFTLVEVVVAAAILLVGVLGVLTLLDAANAATSRNKKREAATNLAREAIEAGRAVPFPDLIPPELLAQLQAQPGLGDATPGAAWEIKRRGTTFALTASVCSVDDGASADGYGDHTGGFFCSDSSSTGTADTNPDDYKRLAITVSWKDGTADKSVKQEAVINNPGSAFAPAIKTLTGNPPPPITSPTTNAIVFTATTSSVAQQITWALDGVERGTVNGPASTFGFTWDLDGIVDGTYLVSAQAYDRYGESGAGRVLTVRINRAAPLAPTGMTGGLNKHWSGLVELEWNPSPERDVTGYRVYRMRGASANPNGDDRICSTSVDDASPTSCQDLSAPTGARYYVVAGAPARTGTGLEWGAPSAIVDTSVANAAPLPPASLTATRLASGGVTLSWPAATDADGTIRYYRIYGDDNSSYTKRIDRTGTGADLSWTNDTPGAADRTYWVTAVDDRLAESDFAPSGAGVTAP